MIELLGQFHQVSKLNNLEYVIEKPFHRCLTVEFLRHEMGNQIFKPSHSKDEAMHELKTPTSKPELRKFIGSMNFYSRK